MSLAKTLNFPPAESKRTSAFAVKSLVFPVAHWRYDIAAIDTGCTVTESTWDRRAGWFKVVGGLATGVSDRDGANAEHIKRTLQRLKERAER